MESNHYYCVLARDDFDGLCYRVYAGPSTWEDIKGVVVDTLKNRPCTASVLAVRAVSEAAMFTIEERLLSGATLDEAVVGFGMDAAVMETSSIQPPTFEELIARTYPGLGLRKESMPGKAPESGTLSHYLLTGKWQPEHPTETADTPVEFDAATMARLDFVRLMVQKGIYNEGHDAGIES